MPHRPPPGHLHADGPSIDTSPIPGLLHAEVEDGSTRTDASAVLLEACRDWMEGLDALRGARPADLDAIERVLAALLAPMVGLLAEQEDRLDDAALERRMRLLDRSEWRLGQVLARLARPDDPHDPHEAWSGGATGMPPAEAANDRRFLPEQVAFHPARWACALAQRQRAESLLAQVEGLSGATAAIRQTARLTQALRASVGACLGRLDVQGRAIVSPEAG